MKRLMMFLLISTVFAQTGFAFTLVQEPAEDVPGAFMKTRPKTIERPVAGRPAKAVRRGPKTTVASSTGSVGGPAKLSGISNSWTTAVTASNSTPPIKNQGRATGPTVNEAPVLQDLGRYWLELEQVAGGGPVRVAGLVPLASGQRFKFHFQMVQTGYLYIVGPGQRNQLTAFLTEKPAPRSGLFRNTVKGGVDFSFPREQLSWMELDKNAGAKSYTVIFSPLPISSPAFFRGEVTGTPLSQAEQADLKEFLAKYQAPKPVMELNDKNPGQPFVQVKVPQGRAAGNPIIFEIRIEHR